TKLGLPTLKQHKKNIENNFYKLTNCAEVFATFSQKLDGTVTSMHSILRKLSSTQQENEAKLNEKKPQNTNAKQTDSSDSFQSTTEQRHANIEDLNATGQNANYEKDKAKIKGIPKELSLYEADLLLNDLYSFYIVDSLRIRPETYSIKDKKNETLRKLFAKLIKEILQNNSENMESILQDIASYDFYKYQQCRNIIKCLLSNVNKNNIWSKALVDIRGEAYWPVFLEELGDARILLKGRADVISNNSIIVLRMFEKKISATNIIDGTYSPPLMLCLLAKLGAFDYVNNGQKIDISEIQIWDMDGLWPNPIKISSIQISPETIDHFENKLRKKLLDYVVNQLTLGENNGKFRHYKRAVLPPASSGNG
ncbi:MAG: hypothetical protein LBG13_02820, partial [Holosporales bacterium]|nr:hypothetical protein [Holosporales bacterium]